MKTLLTIMCISSMLLIGCSKDKAEPKLVDSNQSMVTMLNLTDFDASITMRIDGELMEKEPLLYSPNPVVSTSGGFSISNNGYHEERSWNVSKNPQGVINGQINFTLTATYPDPSQIYHVVIDANCLKVFDNRAWFGGVVIQTNMPQVSVGDHWYLAVEDNGEGAQASPDMCIRHPVRPSINMCDPIYFNYFFTNYPTNFAPIANGNIQVNP